MRSAYKTNASEGSNAFADVATNAASGKIYGEILAPTGLAGTCLRGRVPACPKTYEAVEKVPEMPQVVQSADPK